jgi:DNA-binding GntR family transcriptional regulator
MGDVVKMRPDQTGAQQAGDPGTSVPERDATVVELRRQRLRPERAIAVLTNRIAAALVHHEPGWQLPRLSVLARQYGATTEDLTAAISELAARGLIRRTSAGQFCRATPAHYVLPLGSSLQGLRAGANPVGGDLSVKSRTVSAHPVRDEIKCALQLAPDESARTLQVLWAVGGEPAAMTATYLAPQLAESVITEFDPAEPDGICAVLPLTPLAGGDGQDVAGPSWLLPRFLHTEMQQPPRWAAQALGLSASDRAVLITTRYDDTRDGKPVALTIAALRPDLLRVTIASSDEPIIAGDSGEVSPGWMHVDGDWNF